MEDSVIIWPSLCGNTTPYDAFWDPALTLETQNPVLTDCFQKTVLVWVPCGWLWLASLLYLPALYRMDTVHKTCSISKMHLWKMVLAAAILIVSLSDFTKTIIEGLDHKTQPPSIATYAAGAITLVTLVLAMLLIRYTYIKGQASSGVLFIFWLLLSISGLLQVLSVSATKSQHVIVYINFALVFLMLISNLFAEKNKKSSWQKKSLDTDERVPLLADNHQQTNSGSETRNNPFEDASFLSKAVFFWLTPIVIKGYRKPLTFDDMWELSKEDSAAQIHETFQRQWEKEREKGLRTGKKPSLIIALAKGFYWKMLCGAVLSVLYQLLKLVNPLLINSTILFVQSNNPYVWQGYVLAFGMFLCTGLVCIFINYLFFLSAHTGLILKSAVTNAIYRKALCISNSARKLTSTGDIVNLMSVDAFKVQISVMNIHAIWTAPFTVGATMYLLYQKLGASCFVGLAFLVVTIPLNSFIMGKTVAKYQRIQMKYKDVRIKLMNEILSGIKVLKLYAWECYFEQKIKNIRSEELNVLRTACLVQTVNFFVSLSSDIIVSLLCFLTYVLSSPDHILTPDITFVSISLFGVLSGPLSLVPQAVMQAINGFVSLERIQGFLLQPEINSKNVVHNCAEEGAVTITNGTFSWGEAERLPLKNINLVVPEGCLVAIVGIVGSGKSSLIQAMLGETDLLNGTVNVKGSMAYVPQQAWIQNMTVRGNILFDKPFHRQKYKHVIEACALGPDLNVLPGGDLTEIGEKGINLSGGQKQRVSLARAVYQDSDIYLFDDPLSAVDSHVGKHIFERVIGPKGILADKTRVLVTHSLTFLSQVDKIVVLQDGVISETGSYRELMERNGSFSDFLTQYLTTIDDASGKIGSSDEDSPIEKQSDFKAMSGTEDYGDLSRKIHRRKIHPKTQLSHTTSVNQKEQNKSALTSEEEVEEGNVKMDVISTYVKAASTPWTLLAFLALLVNVGGMVGTNIWLSSWTNDGTKARNGTETVNVGLRLGVYGTLGLTQSLGILLLSVSVTFGCIEAARCLHNKLLSNILRSPMSFFDTTPLGRILNRFSKDVDTLDAELMVYVQNWLALVGNILSVITIIIYSTPIFVTAAIPMIIIFIILQKLYITSARQIKRIDSIKRSPMYANFSETLNGVSSIRAYKQQDRFIRQADRLLDDCQKMRFAVFTSNRWICVWAEFIGNTLMLFAAVFCIMERNVLDAGTVGLSLSFALQLSYRIPSAVRYCSELETNIVAVERVKEYSEKDREAPWILHHRPPPEWPSQGVIEFSDYQMCYRPGLDLVLKGISGQVQSNQMVGVVGRTGAGKSSLALALFRIIESAGGSIVIDGENIADVGLHDLRSRLTIIPQDPVVFSGCLRFNVDPADQYNDTEVWRALEQANLKEFVAQLPNALAYEVGEEGKNLSVGQRQLVCLARALLRNTKILVLDEATAAVDLETDDLIQTTIRRVFKGCTVLTIAHRLNTVLDCDRVMVIENGLIKEFDSPPSLLQNTSSMFYSMARDAGVV